MSVPRARTAHLVQRRGARARFRASVSSVAQRAWRSRHHPIFAEFAKRCATQRRAAVPDYVGAWTRPEFYGQAPIKDIANPVVAPLSPLPAMDEEYFEWVDLLSAVVAADQRFVMLEIGAGFGRWGVRGARAAKLVGVPQVLIGFAEAEPTHCCWLRQHVCDNGLLPEETLIWECAVSDRAGETFFYTSMPDGKGVNGPGLWYGQSISREEPSDPSTEAKAEVRFASGYGGVRVKVKPLSELMEGLGTIDLIDMDVQGEELKIVEGAIDALDAQVRRLHIGTHNAAVETGLRQILSEHGWVKIHDYAACSITRTPFGKVRFQDGVQSWLDPRLATEAL